MFGIIGEFFGFGGGDDGSRRIENPNGCPNIFPTHVANLIDPHIRERIFRGQCLSRDEVNQFRREMDMRMRREGIDYRLVRCRR